MANLVTGREGTVNCARRDLRLAVRAAPPPWSPFLQMSKLANLKKKAADLEHKRLFDRALVVYEEVLQEQEGAEEADISLFNRVGDLHLRQGNVEAALKRYEQAVDLYVERGFHNNAVALCNKILRQDPRRAEIHFRLGQISCEKGFRSEARRHFQEYAAQLMRGGSLESALTTMRNFADENEHLDDARQILADILLDHNRVDEAVAQLGRLHEQYEAHQRHGDAQAVLSRVLELDPDFEISHSVASDADRDDGGGAGGNVEASWSQRVYAAPELVLFDPADLSTTSGATPSGTTSGSAATAVPPADDIVLLDLEPAIEVRGAEEIPDGLNRGSGLELSDGPEPVGMASGEAAPLDFQSTSVELVPPSVDAMEGLDDVAGPTALEIDGEMEPIELATMWHSEPAGWEIPVIGQEDDEHRVLELTLPDDETDLVFITDDGSDASSGHPDQSFVLPDLATDKDEEGQAESTAPAGGWNLTAQQDSDAGATSVQFVSASSDTEWLDAAGQSPAADGRDDGDHSAYHELSHDPGQAAITHPRDVDAEAAVVAPSAFPERLDDTDHPVEMMPAAATLPLVYVESHEDWEEVGTGQASESVGTSDLNGDGVLPESAVTPLASEAVETPEVIEQVDAAEPAAALEGWTPADTHEVVETSAAIEASGLTEQDDGIEWTSSVEYAGFVEPHGTVESSAVIQPSQAIEFSDTIELSGYGTESASSEFDTQGAGVVRSDSTAHTDPSGEAEHRSEAELVEGTSTTTGAPVPAVSEPAEEAFVNLGDWLREEDEPRSTRMVVEERAPSGDEQADFAEMLRKFKQGVADNVDEDDHASHYDLGIAFREMGLVDEAIAAFQRALRGTAQRVRSFEALGQCFIDKGQYAVATSVLQRSLQEPDADDGRLVGVLYLLGRSAEAQNQRTEALGYYQRVFAVDIEFGDVADRIGAVERVPL